MLRRIGLRRRLTLGYLAFLVAGLAAIGGFQYFALRAAVLDERAGSLRDQALYAVQVRGGADRATADPGALVIAASSADVRAALYDSGGRRVALSAQEPVASPWAEPPANLGRSPYSILDAPGGRVLAVRVDIAGTGFNLVLQRSLAGTEALLHADLVSFGLTAAAVLVVAGGLGVWLAGGSVGRLEREIERQRESEAAVRRALADASHELRTPLTALRGNLDVLIRSAAANPRDLGTSLNDMLQTVGRMSRLVDEVLTLALPGETAEIRVETVEVAPLLAEVARSARHLASEHSIGVKAHSGLAVLADRDSLHQVLLNLVDNAVKYSRRGRPVELRAWPLGADQVAIEVEDRGAGVSAQDRPHIFERFYRGKPSGLRQNRSGTGLGLSISAALVARQGGRIEVESEEGLGSTFSVILPRARSLDEAH